MGFKLFKQKKSPGIKNLVFSKAHNIPEVNFNMNGVLELKGRLIPEDANSFFEGLIEWVKELKSEKVQFIAKLEYINSTSSQNLLLLFKEIENNSFAKEIFIDWYFESDDPESKELGELMASNLNKCVFRLIDCEDLDEL